jgi:hypothetical protein
MAYPVVVFTDIFREIIRDYGPRVRLSFFLGSKWMQKNLVRAMLTFTRSVIGSAKPYAPRSSKNGEEEKVVAWEVRTILRQGVIQLRLAHEDLQCHY